MKSLKDASDYLKHIVTEIGFKKQSFNDCVPYSIMLNAMYRAAARFPYILEDLEIDKTFTSRIRKMVGVKEGVGIYTSLIKHAQVSKNDDIEIDCGKYLLILNPRGGLTRIKKNYDVLKQYIKMERPVIISMTYTRSDHKTGSILTKADDIPGRTRIPNKHNTNLIGIYEDEVIKLGDEVFKGMGVWMDTSTERSYDKMPKGMMVMPREFLEYSGNLSKDGIADAYVTNPIIINKKTGIKLIQSTK